MAQKISITLECPLEIKRIANGEGVIWQAGPDEINVEVHEGDVQDGYPLEALHKLLAEYEMDLRRAKLQMRRAKIIKSHRSQTTGANQ